MKKVISGFVLIIMLAFGGCKPHSNREIVVFPTHQKATLSEISIPDVLAMPQNIVILCDNIIIHDALTDWVFKVFSKENFEFKGNLIRRGRGPMEEVDVPYLFRSFGKDAFLFKGTNAIKVANIQEDAGGLHLNIMNEFVLPAAMLSELDFFLLNNKLCSSISIKSPEKDFRCFHFNTDSVFEWGEYIPVSKPALPPYQIFYLAKFTTVHPDGSRLAVVYQNLPILRIYCTESGKVLHQLYMADGSKNEELLQRNLFESGFLTYYWKIKSTGEYIYGLYRGAELSFEEGQIPDFASKIHIWKWDGTPVMSLELNRPIFSFDITPDNKQIIALSIVDVEKLFVTEIPWN